jgi:hypothetical protein
MTLIRADLKSRRVWFSALLASFSLTLWSADLPFSHIIVDPLVVPNGHKPKVIGDFAANGQPGLGAETAGQGFKLYQPPEWTPHLITTYGNGAGDEDAQVADVNNDGALDIVVGGQNGNTYWLENPLRQGRDPYNSTWSVHQIGSGRPSHDVVVGDINGDGKIDVATESGVYLQGVTPGSWSFVGAPNINRDLEGTALIKLSNDSFLDLIAPYQNATQLAWFENPLHRGADPLTNVWTPHVIDATPGFSGYMTIAVADLNQDGRLDVAMCPMYINGTLVWYEGPPAGTSSWVKHVIGPVSYVHQGSLQVLDFDGNGNLDIAFAEQEQSASKRIGIFFNQGSGSSWALQVLATSGGHNPKAGIISNDKYPSIWTANHGYYGAPDPLELWRNLGPNAPPQPPPPPQTAVSDDFNTTVLSSIWSQEDPMGNCSFGADGSHAVISVPGGTAHDLWTTGNFAPRLMQPMTDSDIVIEAKFDSGFAAAFQMQGIQFQQDSSNYLRFETYYDGLAVHVYVASFIQNIPTQRLDLPIGNSGSQIWLRVIRQGAAWSVNWSRDGTNFANATTFSYALTATRVGVHAGNDAVGVPPAFTARIDYFHVSVP